MLLSESAVETLERNSPSGLLAFASDGANFSTCAKYFSALALSPDLMEDIRPESALLKALCLPLEELDADDVEDAASSVKSELL
jgi:hypothetical protein